MMVVVRNIAGEEEGVKTPPFEGVDGDIEVVHGRSVVI